MSAKCVGPGSVAGHVRRLPGESVFKNNRHEQANKEVQNARASDHGPDPARNDG